MFSLKFPDAEIRNSRTDELSYVRDKKTQFETSEYSW